MILLRDLSIIYAIFFTVPMFLSLFESRYSARRTRLSCG